MTESHFERLEALFEQARGLDPHEQQLFLREACGSDAPLLDELTVLLAASQRALPFASLAEDLRAVNQRMFDSFDRAEVPDDGAQIGPYRLIERIGEGGFGVVFRASQEAPIRREVALKVIKLGMDTRRVVARFEAERQTLALMDHPNIARVFDGGATATGRPYFVMELVHGMPITEFCELNRLDLRRRLQLFVRVCHAVQHAHARGIVHRDIKPANVLVTLTDGEPAPKVIDFGIAKAIQQPLTPHTVFTRRGQMLGTPAYMSPEQIAGDSVDVDTRTDIYSLGALLYELLTGTTPFPPESSSAGLDGMRRVMNESQPQRPSTRLSKTARRRRAASAASSEVGLARAALPSSSVAPSFTRQLRGDLDWITMKCLERAPDSRYETVSQLALDIERHLNTEPITARPPSRSYRLRKFAARHRWMLASVGTIGLLTVGSLVVTSAGLSAATQANADLQTALQRITLQQQQLEERTTEAQRQTAIATAVNRFLNEDLLTFAVPDDGGSGTAYLRSMLGQASLRIDQAAGPGGRFADQPRIEAQIRSTLGVSYCRLRMFDESERHLQRAVELVTGEVGEFAPETMGALNRLADLYHEAGRWDQKAAVYERLVDLSTRVYGQNADTTLRLRSELAGSYATIDRPDAAEAIHRSVLELRREIDGPEASATLYACTNLAFLLNDRGRTDEALAMHEDVLETRLRVLGENHPETLESMKFVASCLNEAGDCDEAVALGLRAVEGQRRLSGPAHPYTLAALDHLGRMHRNCGEFEAAAEAFQECVDSLREEYGVDHPLTLDAMRLLASACREAGRDTQADELDHQITQSQR